VDQGNRIEDRKEEAQNRPAAASELLALVEHYKNIAQSTDDAYAHLNEADRSKLEVEAVAKEAWLQGELDKQKAQPAHADPSLRSSTIRQENSNLRAACHATATKPKPKPVVEEKKDEKAADAGDADLPDLDDGKSQAGDAAGKEGEKTDDAAAAAPEGDAAPADDLEGDTPAEGDAAAEGDEATGMEVE
jgi:heat shock protein 4